MKNEEIIRISREEFNTAKEEDQDERNQAEHDIRFAIND